jgi:DNA-binding beta-propeller fold protein YncE
MNRLFVTVLFAIAVAAAFTVRAETPNYFLFVSNERSGDVTVIDGSTDVVVVTFPSANAVRGFMRPDGTRFS